MTGLAAWTPAIPAMLAALAIVLVPGLIATAPLRAGLVARAALSGVVSIACAGAAGILAGLLGIRFAVWQPLVLALVIGLLVLAARRWIPVVRLPRERTRWWWLVLTWIGASALVAVVAFGAVASPDRISQTYDNVFHLSAIAHILDTGDASSLTLRTLIETDRTWSFYPAAWHSLVALVVQSTGCSIPVAVNAMWLVVAAAVWLPGVAWLAQVLVRGFAPGLVALVALPLGAAFGAMPYVLLSWGTLYPTFLATAALPVAVALPVLTWTRIRVVRRPERWAVLALGAAATAVALVSIGLAQPRVLATWLLLGAPFVVIEASRAFIRARRRGGRSRILARRWLIASAGVLVVGAAVAFAYAVLRLGLFTRPLDDRLGGPQAAATQSVLTGIWQVLAQSWPTGIAGAVTIPAALLAVAVLIGCLVAARRRGLRWVVVSYALVAVLFALAAGSDDVLTKLATGIWYKDRYRLNSALPVLGVALASLGILVAACWATRRRPATRAASALALTWVTAVTAALSLGLGGATSAIGFAFRLPDRGASSEVVSQAQLDFMARLAQIVPEGERVLGDPWDGSAWTLVFGDREPVFPHVNGQWDAGRLLIASNLQDIGQDPAVCAALDALRVRYVLFHPHEFGGGDPSGNHFAAVHRAVGAGLFEPEVSDGDSTLYRIDQCGPLPPT